MGFVQKVFILSSIPALLQYLTLYHDTKFNEYILKCFD